MAWTVPMTFTAGAPLTAAQLNTHLRDNMLESATAKASRSGQMFVSTGKFQIGARLPTIAVVEASETTTSSSYVDLATPGPSVTVETSTRAMIFMAAESESTSANSARIVSFKITGATKREPHEETAIRMDGNSASNGMQFGQADLISTLTPGVNTFTLQYKTGSGTATFRYRNLVVWPL